MNTETIPQIATVWNKMINIMWTDKMMCINLGEQKISSEELIRILELAKKYVERRIE